MPDHKFFSSFDSLIKTFLTEYKVATTNDVSRIIDRLDRLERLISKAAIEPGRLRKSGDLSRMTSASSVVLSVIKDSKEGADFSQIKKKTGYDDKKLRNIIFRLNKIEKIKRLERGIYVFNEQ
ncbi:hypothetical protein [Desulforegula conservatrix]|uniref:hypothetical protein n=1 Tax=Desulforegula conservatrix TaxID=153026 RepID=UPI0003FF9231|nr:hypothetical protein [Desulforegula conservatrix]